VATHSEVRQHGVGLAPQAGKKACCPPIFSADRVRNMMDYGRKKAQTQMKSSSVYVKFRARPERRTVSAPRFIRRLKIRVRP